MITCGDDVKGIRAFEKIMRSMPRRFNSVVISIEESVTIESAMATL
jgi:hypothetical protein